MSDKISLIVAGREIADFTRYTVESDLFEAADRFSFELADPDIRIPQGARCQLKVNGRTELTGIIDCVRKTRSKTGGRRVSVEGRDLMGLLVDSYCTSWPDIKNISLKALTRQLLQDIPFIKGIEIKYGRGNKNRAAELTAREEEYEYTQIKPGQTVFEVLKEKALSRGLLFFSLPDGTLMFGEPETGGKAAFNLVCRRDGRGNNILEATLTDDISRRYSSITVTGQVQGGDGAIPADINVRATIADPTFPFYKPYVAEIEHDGQSPKAYAKILLDGMLFDGWSYEAVMPGHTQNGANYQVNAVYHVRDEDFEINADLLCYSRTFELSKDEGKTTRLRLSKLGVLPA